MCTSAQPCSLFPCISPTILFLTLLCLSLFSSFSSSCFSFLLLLHLSSLSSSSHSRVPMPADPAQSVLQGRATQRSPSGRLMAGRVIPTLKPTGSHWPSQRLPETRVLAGRNALLCGPCHLRSLPPAAVACQSSRHVTEGQKTWACAQPELLHCPPASGDLPSTRLTASSLT